MNIKTLISGKFPEYQGFLVTVQKVTVPRGADLQMQVNPETYGCQTA